MATGIVGAAANAAGVGAVSAVLLRLAMVLYVFLPAYHLWRFARHRNAVIGELEGAAIFNYLTFVAAGALLGSGLLNEGAGRAPAWVLLAISGIAGTAIFATIAAELLVVGSLHPRREAQGGWLLAVVAPQALSVLVAELSRGAPQAVGVAASASLWTFGSLLYPPIAAERVARLRLGRSAAGRLRADDWILSGAVAISALAGTYFVEVFADPAWPGWLCPALVAANGAQLALAWTFVPLLLWGELRHMLTPPAHRGAGGSRWGPSSHSGRCPWPPTNSPRLPTSVPSVQRPTRVSRPRSSPGLLPGHLPFVSCWEWIARPGTEDVPLGWYMHSVRDGPTPRAGRHRFLRWAPSWAPAPPPPRGGRSAR